MDNKAGIAVAIIVVLLAGVALSACGTVEEKPKPQIPDSKSQANPKTQIPTPELEARVQALIKQLGDNSPKVRESATTELIKIGTPVKKYVEDALKSKDREVKLRCEKILEAIVVMERVKFSDKLLKWYPTIYQ